METQRPAFSALARQILEGAPARPEIHQDPVAHLGAQQARGRDPKLLADNIEKCHLKGPIRAVALDGQGVQINAIGLKGTTTSHFLI